ncbi:hypothetical protein QTP81_10405 [Alteromonas sp. ASW11-36]|uniref:Uncharacterized protein n=1 Tax=Alteromonas arenosi TaxID=3055817 RepID=A0ABT7SXU3_9ALTE|nr:hypothetical protein [Alteromonas sp. ASW11-36]MDM7861009.1 hypothetical protein [Alteromonas sp. ASW11-36]
MRRISTQDLTSYAALIVACVALYVGWDQSRIYRAQQHADVFPVVELSSQYVTQTTAEGDSVRVLLFSARNEGVGPAFIGQGAWEIAGKNITHAAEIKNLFPSGLSSIDEYQGQIGNYLLGAGEEKIIWQVTWPNNPETQPIIQRFMDDFWQMKFDICYCSLYERCWVSTYNASHPRPGRVESCPIGN